MKLKDDFPFPKVELHVHLAGCIRYSTLLDISQKRGIPIKSKTGKIATTLEEVRELLVTSQPSNLSKVLEAFDIIYPVIKGDLRAVERIAYEMCEDQKAAGIIYFEGRYSPHPMTFEDVSATDVVAAVHRGFSKGEDDFGVKARSILCACLGREGVEEEILKMATELKHLGVVGIDAAGSSKGADEKYDEKIVWMFQEAAKRGIHRTVHAGESGSAKEVMRALDDMKAERIGHGYRIMQNPEFYQSVFVSGPRIHLEACPLSSVMTGSVPPVWKEHPMSIWANDDANFSISRDDPTCFDNTIATELATVKEKIGLSLYQIWKCQLNAAHASFLSAEEKTDIIERIMSLEPK